MIEQSISPQTLSVKDRMIELRNRTIAKLAQYKGVLKTATLTAAALLTTAGACDGTPSTNVGDINAGVGGTMTGCTVTITGDPANVRSSTEVLNANGKPSDWNVIGSAAKFTSYPQTAYNPNGQSADSGNPFGSDGWFAIPFNGETGWVNETVANSNCD